MILVGSSRLFRSIHHLRLRTVDQLLLTTTLQHGLTHSRVNHMDAPHMVLQTLLLIQLSAISYQHMARTMGIPQIRLPPTGWHMAPTALALSTPNILTTTSVMRDMLCRPWLAEVSTNLSSVQRVRRGPKSLAIHMGETGPVSPSHLLGPQAERHEFGT